ncbi:hypothetical protein G7Y89_g5655 [Cudoniella acicularis]|uniref:Cytochrome P450 n=1 Tax=Cudoniella acicularis TaxID=354080 RepID=A0A8H4RP89_9HELO|nr:hypothetical protein G7Y89_g5655 [Cudoniella acicularis]
MFSNFPILYPLLSLLALAFLVHWIHARFFSARSLPKSLPWAGVNDSSVLSRAISTYRSLFHTRELLYEAYEKDGIPFVLPNVVAGPEVILPQSMMDWLLHHPDNVLDQNEVNRDFLQADYTMLHEKVIHDSVHAEFIRKALTQHLGDYTGDVAEEVDFVFRKVWGIDSESWKEVVVYDTMSEIIARISNRVLVGLPLCRNDNYVYHSSRFARWVILEASTINMLPNFLKPSVLSSNAFPFDTDDLGHIIPIWKQASSAPILDGKKKTGYIQWCLDHADTPIERGSDMISKRLSALSFAVIQSSVITLSNLLFDLAASPLTPTLMSTIQQYVFAELQEDHGIWTKSNLARIIILDSVLRESMRLWGFVSRGVLKTVVAPKGINLPGYGHLPCGTKVGIHANPVHHDEKFYDNAYEFQPLRFCTPGSIMTTEDGKAIEQKREGTPLVNTSSTFMAFSHGKHACPGRFFATQQLKLVLAYIAINYEIAPIPQRPANNWIVGSSGPPLKDTIRIRRIKGTA